MTRVPTRDLLEDLLVPVTEAHGLDLEDVSASPVGRRSLLRVVVDKDGGVTLDEIADLTRAVSAKLDHAEAMEDLPYTLEVTSPGVDRPLTLPRHWRRNADRLVEVQPTEGASVIGRIVAADDAGVQLLVDGEQRRVAYAEVDRARIQVEFTKPGRRSAAEEG